MQKGNIIITKQAQKSSFFLHISNLSYKNTLKTHLFLFYRDSIL